MQQKLLLVVAAVIVGVAALNGLRSAHENLRKANQDAVVQDLLVLAGRAQSWYRTPPDLGGGGGSFEGITLAAVLVDSLTANGTLQISERQRNSFRATGTGSEGGPLRITFVVYPDSISQAQIFP